MSTCICLEKQDFKDKQISYNCQQLCPNPKPKATCGSLNDLYVDVYEHKIDFEEDMGNIHEAKHQDYYRTCMVVKRNDAKVFFKAVNCSGNYSVYCWTPTEEKISHGEISKADADTFIRVAKCQLFGDDWKTQKDKIPSNNEFIWTTFTRTTVPILKTNITMYKIPSISKCLLETDYSWNNTRLALESEKDTHVTISLSCNMTMTMEYMCKDDKVIISNVDSGNDGSNAEKEHNTSTHITIGLEYTFDSKMNWITTMPTQVEIKSESTIENSTSKYEFNTTNNPFLFDNSVFFLQIGITISVSCFVLLIATLSCCIYRPKRGTYTFPISRSEENIVMAVEGQSHQPTAVLAVNYSDPVDQASISNEVEGPRFCATKPCQNTNYTKTENSEYQHLDFTLRSETAKRFADTSEYDHVRGNVVSVFDQPWDTTTSKVNKLFSQISKSVVQKGQNVRKSLIKRRVSRSGSPKLKNRASNYCEAWKTQLNNQQFVLDSDVDNQSDISIDVANSTVDSKDNPELRRTDSAFPVLPFKERIRVKSTHIYDEPDDRRMSLRERLLHMISIRPLKMPFGIELDLRASRSKSKIYSLATSIEEIDESVA